VHCYTPLAHGHTGCVALRHGRGARTYGVCSIAPRPWRTDTHGVVHRYTPVAHGHTGRGALLHARGARTHGPWCIATRPWRTNTRGVVHCYTPVAHGHRHDAAMPPAARSSSPPTRDRGRAERAPRFEPAYSAPGSACVAALMAADRAGYGIVTIELTSSRRIRIALLEISFVLGATSVK